MPRCPKICPSAQDYASADIVKNKSGATSRDFVLRVIFFVDNRSQCLPDTVDRPTFLFRSSMYQRYKASTWDYPGQVEGRFPDRTAPKQADRYGMWSVEISNKDGMQARCT